MASCQALEGGGFCSVRRLTFVATVVLCVFVEDEAALVVDMVVTDAVQIAQSPVQ